MDAAPDTVPDFRDELTRLKERLLAMGGEAEKQVRTAVQALVEADRELATAVISGDEAVNDLQLELDDRCLDLLRRGEADDTELRVIVSGLKISNDLERIGDFAVNIAEATLGYVRHYPEMPLIDIPRMGQIAQEMLRAALNAYVRHDLALANEVLARDDEVDGLKNQVFRELVRSMTDRPDSTQGSLDLILISRHIERVADHATNVAEDVIFMVSGRDVRHHRQEGGS